MVGFDKLNQHDRLNQHDKAESELVEDPLNTVEDPPNTTTKPEFELTYLESELANPEFELVEDSLNTAEDSPNTNKNSESEPTHLESELVEDSLNTAEDPLNTTTNPESELTYLESELVEDSLNTAEDPSQSIHYKFINFQNSMKKGFVYILKCSDGSYYTGSTVDLDLRLKQHQAGEGANHTKKRLPVELVYYEPFQRIDEAFYREKQLQGWSRKKKEALIEKQESQLPELAKNYTQFGHIDDRVTVGFDKLNQLDKLNRLDNPESEPVEDSPNTTTIPESELVEDSPNTAENPESELVEDPPTRIEDPLSLKIKNQKYVK